MYVMYDAYGVEDWDVFYKLFILAHDKAINENLYRDEFFNILENTVNVYRETQLNKKPVKVFEYISEPNSNRYCLIVSRLKKYGYETDLLNKKPKQKYENRQEIINWIKHYNITKDID